jgi:2-keto-4-pentenoate hydratase/2-oxohepta-3-ene-1,7-dioic acid hydratase in catechol pathway
MMRSVYYHDREVFPSKVVCVGRNYVAHIHELKNEIPEFMVLFNKPNSAITDTLSYIEEDCRFEGEICFLIEHQQIVGVGFGLDLTKANEQQYLKDKGLPWERAKAFDKSAVFGKFVQFDGDVRGLEMKLYLNDALIQHARYDLMIYKPAEILAQINTFMSLEDGDIIMSGTPKGVSTYKRGESFMSEILLHGEIICKDSFIVQ